MKTFVQVYLCTLVCLSFALMFFGNTADAQTTYSLTGEGATGKAYDKDATVNVKFILTDNTGAGISTMIRLVPQGVEIVSPGRRTDSNGILPVTVKIVSTTNAFLMAEPQPVGTYSVRNTIIFNAIDRPPPNPTRIVILPPNSPGLNGTGVPTAANPTNLAVGDTFEQQVWIKNVTDLSAWQMDITFNPQVLEATMVAEGDFLADENSIPFFRQMTDNTVGIIKVSQARIGQKSTTDDQGNAMTELEESPEGLAVGSEQATGQLLTIEFEVLEFAEGALGLQNVQLSSSTGQRISYYSVINPFVVTHEFPPQDVNRDGEVNVMDLVAVAAMIGSSNPINPRIDVNDDGIISVLDLVAIYQHPSWSKSVAASKKNEPNEWVGAAPAASVGDISPETIQGWIDLAHVEDDGSIIFNRGIANLQRLLASEMPSETRLLLNYPNPFNPETWIPYQLAKPAEVTLTIYSVNGKLVRTLPLGHQSAGLYQNRGQAAYWDGRTELGTQVASGIYFYTLKAGDFSSTRKMIVRK